MLVDNPVPYPSTHPAPYDPIADFLNLDLFASAPPHSSSPRSPPLSLPPSSFSASYPTDSDPSFFNFGLEDDYTKADPLAAPPAVPFDFLSAFTDSPFTTSPAASSSPDSLPSLPSPTLAIDPQLMGTPSTMRDSSEFDEDEEDDQDHDEDDEPELLAVTQGPPKKAVIVVPPVAKSAGSNKARKGTVLGGGVVKKTSPTSSTGASSIVRDKENSLGARENVVDDGRPPDYAKLSSKEKRQLRNKISARNFRVRRKEYITMLEGDVAERDRLLEAIRTELGTSLSENQALREEINALKKALLGGRGATEIPVLPPPAPIPIHVPAAAPPVASSNAPSTPPATATRNPNTTPNLPLITPNTQKDLPTSPRLGSRGFWGGAGVGIGGLGGVTPVHTTLVPEWGVFGTLTKPVSSALQENMNPNLNAPSATAGVSGNGNANAAGFGTLQGFDAFAEHNSFTLKGLDAWRMQLWGKMAVQQHAAQRQQQTPSQEQQQPLPHSTLLDRMRPHYFASSTRQTYTPPSYGGLFSGKAPAFSPASSLINPYPSPPSSPHLSAKNVGSSSSSIPTREQQQTAVVAALASQTLFKKLGSAFWEAFSGSGSGPTPATGGTRTWDAEKVRKVLEGKAVVRVVDIDNVPSMPSSPESVPAALPLATAVNASASTSNLTSSPVSSMKHCVRETGACAVSLVTDILEESMRSLSIAKKTGSA